jgi:aminoglycoside 3-N-acetyltransferase
VLLLGVGHDSNTSLHLAEFRAEWPSKKPILQGAPILVEDERQWVEIQDVSWDDSDFERIGADFEQAGPGNVRRGPIGMGEARLFAQKNLVDFAVTWMETHRQ